MTGTPSVIESVRGKTGQQNSKTARRKSAAQRETGEELEQHRVKNSLGAKCNSRVDMGQFCPMCGRFDD